MTGTIRLSFVCFSCWYLDELILEIIYLQWNTINTTNKNKNMEYDTAVYFGICWSVLLVSYGLSHYPTDDFIVGVTMRGMLMITLMFWD